MDGKTGLDIAAITKVDPRVHQITELQHNAEQINTAAAAKRASTRFDIPTSVPGTMPISVPQPGGRN